MNILRAMRDGLPLHYATIAERLSETPNLTAARLTLLNRRALVFKVQDIGRGWFQITPSGLRRLTWLEANDPGE
jgi:hypothetical protein